MNWDLSDLPDDITIQIKRSDLVAFADRLIAGYSQIIPVPVSEGEDLLDFEGMCRFLKIAPSTGYAKTASGELPHFKKGRKLWFRRSELIKWLEQGRRKTKKDIDELAEMYLKNSKR